MGYGIHFGRGIQRVLDQHQAYARTTTPVYLRRRNFADVSGQQYAQLGRRLSPSGNVVTSGFTDTEIAPPPSMLTLSLHNIGISGGKLRFGAKTFRVSSTFVDSYAKDRGIVDVPPKSVFLSSAGTIGLINENMLYSIEDIQHETVAGHITAWLLTCNANELK